MTALPAVLGVDPSLTGTGIALPDGTTRTIRTKPRDGSDLDRIRTIRNTITGIALRADVDLVVLEDLAFGAKGSAVHLLAGLAYAIRMELDALTIRFAIVGTGQLKKYATGNGQANKTAMALALQERARLVLSNDNEVDAWWLRAMGLDQLGHPPVPMPKTHRDVLSKVVWPRLEVPVP